MKEAFVECLDKPIKVYNFEVEDWHTYFVSVYNVFVHNTCGGRRGNQKTRDHIDQVRDEFMDANPDYKHVAGGRDRVTGAEIPEEFLPGPGGGRKGSSYPDLTFEAPDQSRLRINTTDTRSNGTMTPREEINFNRIFDQTNEPIISIPKP